MPLTSLGDAAEYFGSEVRFAMREASGDAEPLWITVTLGALDGLAPADLDGPQLADWVDAHRSSFETIASAKFDQGQPLHITANDWIARFPLPA